MKSCMGYLYFFCMYGKKRPIAIPWYQISIPQVFMFQVHRGKQLGYTRIKPKMSSQGMNWNILDASLLPPLQSLFYHTERNDNCTCCVWEGAFWVPTHIFIQHLVFMAVFDWILGWCQFTPPGVPIHPSCANSPRPVVNFIFFNKTKTEVPEVLKMFMRRGFMHSSHAYMLQLSSC